MQKMTFYWQTHNEQCATLRVNEDSELRSEKHICFSQDQTFAKRTEEANLLQKGVGEKLQNLEHDRFPLVRKLSFGVHGIEIVKTEFKDWKITGPAIQKEIIKVLEQENIKVTFTNGY